MERWSGRVAVVTGASAGIGAAIAQELVKKRVIVVGLARRVERVQKMSSSLEKETGKLYAIKCDITNEKDIHDAFNWIKSNLGGVDILINNAGFISRHTLLDGPEETWRRILDVNVYGLSVCTKAALQSMNERGIEDGYIVNINSLAGHMIPEPIYLMYMYTASKHAVTVLTEGLRRELVQQKSKIRISSVSPGFVKTEMVPESLLKLVPYLECEDIVDAVIYILGTPENVQISELSIASTE